MAGTRRHRPPEDSPESSTSDVSNNMERTKTRNHITKKVQTVSSDAHNSQDACSTPQTVENNAVCLSAPTTNITSAPNQQLLQLMNAALARASEAVAATSETLL
jgi:hypothetical protein